MIRLQWNALKVGDNDRVPLSASTERGGPGVLLSDR